MSDPPVSEIEFNSTMYNGLPSELSLMLSINYKGMYSNWGNHNHYHKTDKSLAKATLTLIPLFGLHEIVGLHRLITHEPGKISLILF